MANGVCEKNEDKKGALGMNQIKFGMFMKELRKRNGLTQEQVAERLNVSNRTVSHWETGTNMPDISLLIEIAKIYDVSIPELIDGEKKSEKINEETDEIARKMSDYAKAEKTTILRSVTKESLLGICALAVLTFLELLGSAARGWLFETAHLYCQVFVYVSVMMIFVHTSGLLYQFKRGSIRKRLPKPVLFLFASVVAAAFVCIIWFILSLIFV